MPRVLPILPDPFSAFKSVTRFFTPSSHRIASETADSRSTDVSGQFSRPSAEIGETNFLGAFAEWPASLLWHATGLWQDATLFKERVLPATPLAATKDLAHYRARAEAMLAGAATPSARNRAITGAYAALFLTKPEAFLWAGMAAYASQQVGLGIAGPFGLRPEDLLANSISVNELLAPFQDGAEAATTLFPNRFRNLLIAGNDGVFRDIVPLFLAYLDGGLSAVTALSVDERLKSGFRLIDAGIKMREIGWTSSGDRSIWEGNKLLLRYEQEVTLQGLVYDPDRTLWKFASGAAIMRFETDPLPDPSRWTYFQQAVPLGDIGFFDDRWEWINGTMLPLWRSLLDNDDDSVRADMATLRQRGETATGRPYPL